MAKRYFLLDLEKRDRSSMTVVVDTDYAGPLEAHMVTVPNERWDEYFGDDGAEWDVTDVTEVPPENLTESERRNAVQGEIQLEDAGLDDLRYERLQELLQAFEEKLETDGAK